MIFETLSSLFYRIFGSAKLRIYETACLEAWKRTLSSGAIEILNKQLDSYNFVQRLSHDKLVGFHDLKDPSYERWPKNAFFPLRAEEAIVAAIRFRPTGEPRAALRGNIILAKGRLSSIEFDRPPKMLFARSRALSDIEVTNVQVVFDPMIANGGATEPLLDTSKLVGWLRDWLHRWRVENLRKALPTKRREQILRQLDTTLPPDYLELISQTEGLKVETYVIYGLSQIRPIVRPDANFYLLAEADESGAIGVKQDEKMGELYYLDREDERPQSVGRSFRAALEQRLKTGRRPKDQQT